MISIDVNRKLVVVDDPAMYPKIKMAWAHTAQHPRTGAAVLPYTTMSAIFLRNFGFTVPAPINYYYDWPGRFIPMGHQKVTSAFLTVNKRAFCLNDMGTGKTLSGYWAADFLMRQRFVRRALVVAPLSTLENVHASTIFNHFFGDHRRTFAVLHGNAKKRRELLAGGFDFYIINHDGVATVKRELAERDDIDLVLLDECAKYRNGSTERWKIMRDVIKPNQWVWGFTGSPTPNEPTDAFAQVRLIKPENLVDTPSFNSFRSITMDKLGTFRWRALPTAMKTVYRVMSPSIRYRRDECIDLPPCTYQTLEAELSPSQKLAYKQLKNSYITQINEGQITAVNEAVMLMRLIQVASGVVYDVTGKHQRIECNHRLNVLKEVIEEAPAKVIVFVPFKGNLSMLEEALGRDHTCALISGDTKPSERKTLIEAFQKPNHGPRVLIAVPDCMSHGLTLTEAATIVWWAPVNKNEVYDQANARINRPGQTRAMQIIHLASTPTERDTYRRLELKQNLQGVLLRLVEEQDRV